MDGEQGFILHTATPCLFWRGGRRFNGLSHLSRRVLEVFNMEILVFSCSNTGELVTRGDAKTFASTDRVACRLSDLEGFQSQLFHNAIQMLEEGPNE